MKPTIAQINFEIAELMGWNKKKSYPKIDYSTNPDYKGVIVKWGEDEDDWEGFNPAENNDDALFVVKKLTGNKKKHFTVDINCESPNLWHVCALYANASAKTLAMAISLAVYEMSIRDKETAIMNEAPKPIKNGAIAFKDVKEGDRFTIGPNVNGIYTKNKGRADRGNMSIGLPDHTAVMLVKTWRVKTNEAMQDVREGRTTKVKNAGELFKNLR